MNTAELKQACLAELEQIPEDKLQEFLSQIKQIRQDLITIQQAANDETRPQHRTTRRLGGMIGTAEIIGDIVEPTEKLETWDVLQ
ncbi:hypothetical protein [Candidatus Albibeggiatoa sp. nov. BB20]|uniref:hypothetical protein n=1 Tax=Candidatus Albibeggiatoa sp. nov. BB20 TaxID=3162723 RepID=UPI0033653A8A